MKIEHAPGATVGTVTMGAVRVGGQLMLEVVAYHLVLREVPRWRGGATVTAVCGTEWGADAITLDLAGTARGYRLLARADGRIEKLPPVQLRIPALPGMDGEEHEAEPVAYRATGWGLRLTLPGWARRTPTSARVLDAPVPSRIGGAA